MTQPFNLKFNPKLALNGAKLVTRAGKAVTGFRRSDRILVGYPYEADISDERGCIFTSDGLWIMGQETEKDLFLYTTSLSDTTTNDNNPTVHGANV